MQWYEIEQAGDISSPALVIYRERIDENIRLLVEMVDGDTARLRPHVKTNKIAEVCALMLDAGIYKFKCATIAEAEMLGMIGAADVLLAYQPVGPNIDRFIQLILQYPGTRFSCLVDNVEVAGQLSAHLLYHQLKASVWIDLNTGMNRSGIQPARALLLYEALVLLSALQVIGLHAYDGHIHQQEVALRQREVETAFSSVLILAETIEALDGSKPAIVAGGSPTFPLHAKNKSIECSPGTFVFWDWGYRHDFPDEPFDYAALVITRIISMPAENTITVDLGHKSLAAENPLPRVHFLNAPEAVPVSHSEEHLVLKVPDASTFRIGDLLYGVPVHICPTVALYETANVVEKNQLMTEWKVIGRSRKINI